MNSKMGFLKVDNRDNRIIDIVQGIKYSILNKLGMGRKRKSPTSLNILSLRDFIFSYNTIARSGYEGDLKQN